MPALSLLDSFTDSDKALASHTPDHPDYAWTNHASFTGTAASVYGNRAVPANGESAAYLSLAVPDRATTNWGVEAPVYYAGTQSGSYGGLFAGVTGAKTGYVVYWYGGTWALGKYVAGTWTALGTYSESFSTGTSKTVRMRFTSTQVIVSIDGTDRITATDSSITPTRMGVYGDRANISATSTGFHLSDISLVGPAILNPARETDAAVALAFVPAGSITCNEYGETRISVGRLAGSPTLERRPSGGGTWYDITSAAHVAMGSGTNRTIVDRRPHYGSGKVDWGGTVEYRLTDGANVLTFSVTADVDKTQVKRNSWAVMSAYMATQTNGCVTSQAGSYYPGEWLMSMALAYLDSVDQGSPNSQYLTDVENQHTYAILPLINADKVLHFPAFAWTDRDHHCRTAAHVATASLLLKFAGATTLSDTLMATANDLGKAYWDKFGNGSPVSSTTDGAWDAANTDAWASGTISAGMIVRPTTPNGRTYRAMTAGTNTTEPTWPTSNGGEVTHQGVRWRDTTVTAELSSITYNQNSPYAANSAGWCIPNKIASEALLMALLTHDSRTDFYSAGTYKTKAQDHIKAVVKHCAAEQGSGGQLAIQVDYEGDDGQYDTLYAAYTMQQLAAVYKLVGAVEEELPLVISTTLEWLETRSGGASEPQTRIYYAGSPPWDSTNVGIGDLMWRDVGARTMGTTSVAGKIPYSAAFWDSATHRYTPYTPDGGATPYSALYQAVWEAEAVIEAIIARIDLTPATETDAAVGLGVAKHVTLTPATETSTPVALTISKRATLTPAAETDTAVALSLSTGPTEQTITLTPATETDTAVALTVSKHATLTPATETDAAVAVTSTKRLTLTPAAETDRAVALSIAGAVLDGPRIPLPATANFVSPRSQTANFTSAKSQSADFAGNQGHTADFIAGPT